MAEAIDMGMEDYGTEVDIDKAYQEVCDEIGVELSHEIAGAGEGKIAASKQKVTLTNTLMNI